jgi:Flp pilus assembly protein TadG
MRPKPLERDVWKRLARDTRGVAAIEFAFLAPVLIVMYFAMVEYCQAYMALKRTDHVAAMVADLTSQNDKFVKSQIEDVFAIGDVIMSPFATTTLTQRVSSVTRVNATTYRVDWSIGKGIASKLTVAEAKVPDDMLAEGDSVIIAEANYDFDSPFDQIAPAATRFKRMAYLRPRTADLIVCSDC